MAVSQEKITVYNLADLKNTSDDAIPNYFNSLKFKQSHRLTDVRLALGYSAFLIAGACFLWDHQLGFQSTKWYTAAAVVVYTILNSALTLWIWAVERGTVYVGTAPTGEIVRITTSTRKNVPQYNVEVEVRAKKGSTRAEVLKISRPFADWFDAAGRFVAAPFQSMLATTIPCVGKLDPSRVVSVSEEYTPELLDAVANASAGATESIPETSGAQIGAGNKKAGKRRKA